MVETSCSTKKRGVPLWFVLVCLTTMPCLMVGAFTIGLLEWGSQNQVDHMYGGMVKDLHNGIISYVDQYFDGMKTVAKGVAKIEPLFRDFKMPTNGSYDPVPLIRFMSLLSDNYRYESIGMMLKNNASATSKLSWQVARGFDCPEFIYAYSDESIYPSFQGHCAFDNETISAPLAYQGTDWGLKPEESLLIQGIKNETFLPVFVLLNVVTLTYSVNHRYSDGRVYGLTFAEKSLNIIDDYFRSLTLENDGVAFIFERSSGLMITASVAGQTSVEDPSNQYSGVRRLQVDQVPNPTISAAGKSILDYYQSFSNVSDYGNIQLGDLLIRVNAYRAEGIDWIVATAVLESEIFSAVRYFAQVALITDVLFMMLVVVIVGLVSLLIARHMRNIQKKLNNTPVEQEKEPLFSSTRITELQDLEDEAKSFHRPMSIHFTQP